MFATLRRLLRTLVTAVQGVVLAVSLVFLYFVGIGVTWVLVHLFQRRTLQRDPPGLDTYWKPAEGYGADRLESPS